MKLWVIAAALAAMGVLRLVRAGLLGWVLFWLAGMYAVLRFGFVKPIPQAAVTMYMAITAAALLAYVGSSRERMRAVFGPIVRLAVDPKWTPALVVVGLAVPLLLALGAYRRAAAPVSPPFFGRTVHPNPPTTITVHGKEVDLVSGDNPLRRLEATSPEEFRRRVAAGRETYYKNCFYCHGDGLKGDGMYARGLNPIPTNFADPGVLDSFQETFFFWRIAKGGPGLPDEGGPWASAMPRWEQFLTDEQMWEVLLFLYDFTGLRPRAREEIHGQER